MTKLKQVYKCNICGNVVEMLHAGAGELVCCGEPMELKQENTVDAAQEKHVPIIEKTENGLLIKIGEVPHPMNEDHYIEWIEVEAGGRLHRKWLKPGDAPEMEIKCKNIDAVSAREYCNLHGLWRS